MKRKSVITLTTTLCLAAGLAVADDDRRDGPDNDRYQTANVTDISGASYHGAAWLIRSANRIDGRIMTTVSTPGLPYTLWILLFNNPSACDGPCDPGDMLNPAVKGLVFNGSGAISAASGAVDDQGIPVGDGVFNVDFSLVAGKLPNDLFVLFPNSNNRHGLRKNRGFRAEIQLVVDKHPAVPAGMSWIADLTTTNIPGMGGAVGDRRAVFLSCPEKSCPESAL